MGRKIVVVRHGERVDFTFGDDWITKCFSNGVYTKNNLNMPDPSKSLSRVGFPDTFWKDSPLTQIGNHQAYLVGKGLRDEKVFSKSDNFDVYVSPAYRTIETARSLLNGMGFENEVPLLKIEPCLFEWTGWFPGRKPDWLSMKELDDFGFKIDKDFTPYRTVEEAKVDETIEEYYNRSFNLVKHLLSLSEGKDLLLVAHAATLDTALRQLLGKPARVHLEMMSILRNIPYCGVAIAEEENSVWSLVQPGSIGPTGIQLRHSSVNDFDASVSLSK